MNEYRYWLTIKGDDSGAKIRITISAPSQEIAEALIDKLYATNSKELITT